MTNDDVPTPTQKAELDNASSEAALDAATAALLTNRFEVIPHPDGPRAGGVLVFGSVLAGRYGQEQESGTPFLKVKMYGAFAVNRLVAADIVVKLQNALQLTDDELKQAMDRSKAAGSTDA